MHKNTSQQEKRFFHGSPRCFYYGEKFVLKEYLFVEPSQGGSSYSGRHRIIQRHNRSKEKVGVDSGKYYNGRLDIRHAERTFLVDAARQFARPHVPFENICA